MQHSWNSGSLNAHIHTNTEEGSVCCGWWWRPSHESQEAAGRNVLRCHTWPRPESLYALGRLKLQTAPAHLWGGGETPLCKKREWHDKDKVSFRKLRNFPLFSLHLCAPRLIPEGTTPKHNNMHGIVQLFTVHTHTHAHTHILEKCAPPTLLLSCLFWIQALQCDCK